MLFLVNISSISNFFHISDHNILILAGMIMFLSFIWTINMAFIQAKLAFGFGVLVSFISACLKLLLGFIFILLGYSVSGAVGAMLLAALGSYLISFIPLKFIFYKKTKTIIIDSKEIMSYAVPSALTMFGLTSFISIDILLVKHLFDPVQAGLYAGLSLVGRIIFFIVAPIGTVMFPIIVRKHTHNESITNTFKASLLMVVLPALFISGFYFIFPEFAILFILKKTEYLEVAGLLGFFGLYISLYCILYLLAMFFLSIKKTRVYYPILSGAILQVALIYNFHESFLQVIIISFVIVLLLVVGFLLYYPYATKK
jgi:O-antigen/teichoic acid export membrane protein